MKIICSVLRSASPRDTQIRIMAAMFAILFYCCNAEKRVLKDADKTQNVVNKYLQTHPARVDTFYNYKAGDTITQLLIGYDTTYVRDTINRRDTIRIKETKYKTVSRVDTFERTIKDYKLLQACQDGMAKNDYKLKQAEIETRENKLIADRWKLNFWVAISIMAASIGVYLLIRFKVF